MRRRKFIGQAAKVALLTALYPLQSCASHTKSYTKLNQPNIGAIPLIIDADTANEIDDLYAIVWALLEPKLHILGITSAQWHTNPTTPNDSVGESQKLNEEIVKLMGKEGIPLPEGSNFPMVNTHRPQPSAAATFIIEQAMKMPEGEKLQIVILGPGTNIASAILLEPKIIPKISVNYLGFWYNVETKTYSKREFNTNNDPNAINLLLNTAGLSFRVMTATTSQHLVFYKKEVDTLLKGKGGIGDYLVKRWEDYDRFWQDKDPEKNEWIMWDIAILQALAYPEWVTEETVTTPHDNLSRDIQVYTKIDVKKAKADYHQKLSDFLAKK